MKAQVIFNNDGTVTLIQIVTAFFSMAEIQFTSVSNLLSYCNERGLVPTVGDTMAVNF
jgi:hypothetical protein